MSAPIRTLLALLATAWTGALLGPENPAPATAPFPCTKGTNPLAYGLLPLPVGSNPTGSLDNGPLPKGTNPLGS